MMSDVEEVVLWGRQVSDDVRVTSDVEGVVLAVSQSLPAGRTCV